MAEERKAFEAAILAANGQVPGNYNPEYDRYVSERRQGQYEGWKLARAQLPSQGGEAVEVVAYHGKDPDGGEGFVGARWPNAFGQECIVEPLMTISQHQRILAASAHPADQLAFEALQHAVAYLSRSPMEAIRAGSALHKLMAQALAKP
jgi:hypothetical protein